jgi:2-desacetyl-2-hydroxyethyl bacteriochlorophyllide A dehydrogenase
MSRHMRAVVKTAPGIGNLSVLETPQPAPAPGEALVRIQRSGLCGTDLLVYDDVYRGRRRPVPYPLILGHEASGEVVELGARTPGPLPGTRVAIEAVTGCGACFHCLRGNYNLCQDWHHIGLTTAGAFAEFVVVPASSLFPLPEAVSLDDAAFLEPLATVIHTLERTRPSPATPTAILGPGPLGLLHVQLLRTAGVGPIIVFGRRGDEARLDVARRVGADEALILDRAEAGAYAGELTNGVGMGLVIETAGTPEAVQTALDITGGNGVLATLGIVRTTDIDALQVMRKNMTWIGVVASVRRHWAEAIRLIEDGRLHPRELVTHRLPMSEALDGFAALRRREAVKVMYDPSS